MESKSATKLILLGNGATGKSSIIARLVESGFQRTYKQTVGLDFLEKTLPVRDHNICLQLWDIGGQSVASPMLPNYIHGAGVVFLCYDTTDKASFDDLDDWLDLVQKHGDKSTLQVFLVGNKKDLEHRREVTQEAHEDFIAKHALAGGFLVSAKSGESVLRSFTFAAAQSVDIVISEEELSFTDKVLQAAVVKGDGNDDLSNLPDDIAEHLRSLMEQDAAAERKRLAKLQRTSRGFRCTVQ